MIPRSAPRLVLVSRKTPKPAIAPSSLSLRVFSTTRDQRGSNRMFSPVRRPEDFSTYVLLSSTSRSPLLTLWTASYCNTCKQVSPVLRELISAGVGEDEGGVSYCEIEYDSPDILGSDLAMTYLITSMPTLLSFDRGEAQLQTKVTDPKKMSDRELLKEWIRTEARRKGSGGGGGGVGFFGGLFGSTR